MPRVMSAIKIEGSFAKRNRNLFEWLYFIW